jgi:hypothetical protein
MKYGSEVIYVLLNEFRATVSMAATEDTKHLGRQECKDFEGTKL